MKRFFSLVLFIAVILLLCSCVTSNERVDSDIKPTPTGEPIEKPIFPTLALTIDQLEALIEPAQTLDKILVYETEDFVIYRTGSGNRGIVCFSEPGSDEIGVVFFLSSADASRMSFTTQNAIESQELVASFCTDAGIEYIATEFEVEDALVIAVAAADSPLNNLSLPLSVRQYRSPNELFYDEERRQTCLSLLSSASYTELYDYVTNYIEGNQITENDIVYELQSQVLALATATDKCVITFDDLERVATIYYDGVTDISDSTNVVPFLTTDESGSIEEEILFGFKHDGWIFFDEIKIENKDAEPETESFSYSRVSRNVLEGSYIEEYVYTPLLNNEMTMLAESGSGTIRFENTEDRISKDHELTESEITALLTLDEIESIHTSIYYSIGGWENA